MIEQFHKGIMLRLYTHALAKSLSLDTDSTMNPVINSQHLYPLS